jgi:hypothetical protein
MRQKSGPVKEPATQVVKNIRRATRRHFSAEGTLFLRQHAAHVRAPVSAGPPSAGERSAGRARGHSVNSIMVRRTEREAISPIVRMGRFE